jgi:hypothetical protein
MHLQQKLTRGEQSPSQRNTDMQDLNKYIKKSHIKIVENFNADLEAFRKETGEPVATLYEDANTSFTLSSVRVEEGRLKYTYDGKEEYEEALWVDEEDGSLSERDDIDSIPEYIKFWRACLRRAKRYWGMD